MKRPRGFTLIELLVVIAIIALLMSILMPALKLIRLQTKALICRSNLHQWGIFFYIYSNDNNGSFNCWDGANRSGYYVHALRPYHKSDYDFLCCPVAPKEPVIQPGDYLAVGGARTNWGFLKPHVKNPPWRAGDYGSYGQNTWTVSARPGKEYRSEEHPPENYWRSANVRGAAYIPLLLDGVWPDAFAHAEDEPPPYEGVRWNAGISRFCINRHRSSINGVFVDFSVKKIGLKELWILKWHRNYDTQGPWTTAGGVQPDDWPEWMRKFKDY